MYNFRNLQQEAQDKQGFLKSYILIIMSIL
jgi:hypothetical protein